MAATPQETQQLPLGHALLALLVVTIWGTNFVVIRIGLDHLPPLLFATLRFAFVFLPAALLLRRPDAPVTALAAYGLLIGVGQFGILYIAMNGSISPGLASVVVQVQVFFTIALACLFRGERLKLLHVVGLTFGASGILLIIANTDGAGTTASGVGLVLIAGLSWAVANLVSSKWAGAQVLNFIIWSGAFAVPPLFLLSLLLEGWPAIAAALAGAGTDAWAAVLWQSVGNTVLGYGIWAWLLQRHPAAVVAPTALLVPIFGLAASALLLAEAMPAWKVIAAAAVIAGVALGSIGPAWRRWRRGPEPRL